MLKLQAETKNVARWCSRKRAVCWSDDADWAVSAVAPRRVGVCHTVAPLTLQKVTQEVACTHARTFWANLLK